MVSILETEVNYLDLCSMGPRKCRAPKQYCDIWFTHPYMRDHVDPTWDRDDVESYAEMFRQGVEIESMGFSRTDTIGILDTLYAAKMLDEDALGSFPKKYAKIILENGLIDKCDRKAVSLLTYRLHGSGSWLRAVRLLTYRLLGSGKKL